jgi:eukaryotic-like serine/threonine-protein kinase
MIGRTVLRYRVIEKLGMGVVYKAEDTRWHCFVALKFLPDDVVKDPLRSPTQCGGRSQGINRIRL